MVFTDTSANIAVGMGLITVNPVPPPTSTSSVPPTTTTGSTTSEPTDTPGSTIDPLLLFGALGIIAVGILSGGFVFYRKRIKKLNGKKGD